MSETSDIKYSQALSELQGIVGQLQAETVDVDELSYQVKRAVELIGVCKEKITNTEMDVKKILDDFNSTES